MRSIGLFLIVLSCAHARLRMHVYTHVPTCEESKKEKMPYAPSKLDLTSTLEPKHGSSPPITKVG